MSDTPTPQAEEKCECYYGVAPHTHDLSRTGSFIGSTVLKPKIEYPPNFHEDPECEGCGTYICTHCLQMSDGSTPPPTNNE